MLDAFTVLPGDEGSPVVIHVPHSSRLIPPEARADLMLGDEEQSVWQAIWLKRQVPPGNVSALVLDSGF
ncbi:hypothetical protein R4P64_29435 [Rhodococcus sp. IEGM 1366]|uniref:hypothetical protein n=1 Tax=Rhodococcus sp. IEGM 1366 TaxID=3082223 RepID=UPI00295433AF|nr:hypothetical protein [Rhodococcus sp. IEGM 1366]MDV8070659.1 hypothetical protein [Rhodococcus sp. IEGM 1366]